MKKIFVAIIPEIFGCGIMVFDPTEKGARKKLKKAFYKCNPERTFKDSMEWWGGYVEEIDINKVYDDSFR